MTTIHVAPHPAGGWLVEDETRLVGPEHLTSREAAVAHATAWLTGHGHGHLVIHDEHFPVAAAEHPVERFSLTL